MQKKKIALVLGGGGARGFAHIGVIKELEKQNIKPDYVVGVSMGALIGATYVSGYDIKEIEEIAKSFNKRKAVSKLFDLGGFGTSLIKGKKIDRLISEMLGDNQFSDTKIPLTIVTSDLVKGREFVIRSGNLKDAVLSSIAVPGIFPPIKSDDKMLVDGGVLNPTPVDVAQKKNPDLIIAVDLVMGKRKVSFNPSMVNVLMRTYDIMRTDIVKHSIGMDAGNVAIVKPKENKIFDSFKFYDIEKFIKSGEQALKKELPKIKKIISPE